MIAIAQRVFGPDARLVHAGWLCVLAGLGLSVIGVYAIDVGSQTAAPAGLSELSPRAVKHAMFLGVGLLAAAAVAWPDYRKTQFVAWPALGACILLLVFLLLPFVPASIVTPRNGTRGWINFGSFDLQPSELTKIAFVLACAEYLRYRTNHRTFLGLLPPAIITGIPMGLIFLEPDLGVAMLFVPALFAMLVAAGARMRHLAAVCAIALCAAPMAYPMLKSYHRQRIADVYAQLVGNPPRVGSVTATQPTTARMLVGSGEVTGATDAKARAMVIASRLPERHNDMIYAVVVARFGLWGGLGVIGLYAMWLLGAVIAAVACKDAFGRLVCVGFCAFVFMQVLVNLGMVVGVAPVIGLTLPFVSYGGSSMLAVWVMTGLVFSIAARRAKRFARPTFEFDD